MGVELQYQGLLPPRSGLVELVRVLAATDPDEAQRVQFVPRLLRAGATVSANRERGAIWDWCREARVRYPGIEDRNLDLDRAFDKLHYLLSARRRTDGRPPAPGEFAAFDMLIDHAFTTADVLALNLRATQGALIKMISPEIVAAIGDCIGRVQFQDISANFDPAKMDDVYKMNSDASPDDIRAELVWLGALFERFKIFFMEAARAKETVIFWID